MRLRSYLALSALFLALPTINTKNSVAAISQVSPSQAQITILYDAFGQNSRMQKDWGYAALVEYGGKRILFDTGNNPRILAENAKAKGIDLTKLDFVVMSHRHGDHMGGLSYLLSVNPKVTIDTSLPPEKRYYSGAPPEVMHFGSAWPDVNFQLIDKNTEIAPDIHLVTLVSDKPGTLELREVSLAINTPEGLIIIVGCAHPGIEKIAESASTINPHIHFIVGGLHLVVTPDPEIERIVNGLHYRFKLDYIAPGHCTGEPAFAALQRAFGGHYVYAGLGATLKLPASSQDGQIH
ncbi:MAG: MBL fold metallo-hydrolase [Acidobacteria bacterium]|nr:MAG: MBL fold metallo-hydrolase [Acidobacteriota bacterium]